MLYRQVSLHCNSICSGDLAEQASLKSQLKKKFFIIPLCYENINIMENDRFQRVLTSTTVQTFTFKELKKKTVPPTNKRENITVFSFMKRQMSISQSFPEKHIAIQSCWNSLRCFTIVAEQHNCTRPLKVLHQTSTQCTTLLASVFHF